MPISTDRDSATVDKPTAILHARRQYLYASFFDKVFSDLRIRELSVDSCRDACFTAFQATLLRRQTDSLLIESHIRAQLQ